MHRYLTSPKSAATHLDPGNNIFIRKDVHDLWDSNAIVFVSKPCSDNSDQSRLFCHVLTPPGKSADSDMEIHSLYHNIPMIPIHNPIELLFARFAWSLFTNTTLALFKDDDGKTKYSVLLHDVEKDKMVEKMLPASSLPRLSVKATGVATKDVAGEKHSLEDSANVEAEPSDTGDVADSLDNVSSEGDSSDGDRSGSPDIGDLGLNDVDTGDLIYSVRTGQMERYDNGAESDDCSLSSHCSHSSRDPFSDLSDDSEPPRKKSRSS
ncbi:uncharacterized protein F4812DRAFT_427864 [Daldinia caldariorum]|uniref:uncharacterized protein n=1 Tax=Daldinia caldariorum TaxID=326644 RepID=UPI0020083862|nr:uncharacterized protein F4812DRAFT_427864 [Daldinia caldariorum]KAI1467857.1 hypothetical protein F4812DRAFT_427864 [Daldinia caldariorum]